MLDIKSKGPGFDPHPGHGDFLRVRDRCIPTLIDHSQDLGMSRLQSIIHKTWAYQDSNKHSQVIGISVLLLIIRKTQAYQLSMINYSQYLDLSRFQSIMIHKTLAYQDSNQLFTRLGHIKTLINHSQDLGISEHMPIMNCICQSCQ